MRVLVLTGDLDSADPRELDTIFECEADDVRLKIGVSLVIAMRIDDIISGTAVSLYATAKCLVSDTTP